MRTLSYSKYYRIKAIRKRIYHWFEIFLLTSFFPPISLHFPILGRGIDINCCLLSVYVSRFHLKLLFNDNCWFIIDLGSFNGTFVCLNGSVCKLEPHKSYQLISGSIIGLGINPMIWNTQQTLTNNPGEYFCF